MMRSAFRKIGSMSSFVMATMALCVGCDTGGEINLVAVYPSDEPELLTDVGVEQIVVELNDADARDADPVTFESLRKDEALHFGDLSEGPWVIVVRGLDATGEEVVSGASQPFTIAKSVAKDVFIFLGRTRSFNRVALSPSDLEGELAELSGHTATPFTADDGTQRILIAGGRPAGETASAEAYVVDPGDFTVTKLDAQMSKKRIGHRAISVEPPGRHALVVIADGGNGPVDALEVFDTKTGAFSTVDVPCAPPVSAGIVPALTRDGDVLVHSGRVILPGAQLCVVDPYGEQEAEIWPSPSGAEPEAPAMSAVNAIGQIVVVDGDGIVSVSSAVEDGDGTDGCTGADADSNGRIAPRVGGALTPVGARDRFAMIGGENPVGGAPGSDWALVGLSGCGVTSVSEGAGGRDEVPETPVVMDLSSKESAPFVDVFVMGGDTTSRDTSALIADAADERPLWYAEDAGFTPQMRAERLGHAIAVLENRSAWVLGGATGGEGAEIFELGDGAVPLGSESRDFALRTPVLTAMTVLDETEEGDELAAMIKEPEFLEALLLQEDVAATLYMLSSADRGISNGDDNALAMAGLPDTSACTPGPITADSVIIDGSIDGADIAGIDYPSIINELQDGDNPVDLASDAISNWLNEMKTTSLNAFTGGGEGPVPLMAPGDPAGSCQWRQYLRAGFDGLGYEGPSMEEKDATYSGVNVLILAVSGDDCSEGVYLNVNNSSNSLSDLPADDLIAETYCDSVEMDDYFGLPPGDYEEGIDFNEVAHGLVWDIRDLVIGIVRRTVSPADPDAGKTSALPRRLRASVDHLVQLGAEVVPVFVEDADDPAFTAQIEVLSDSIARRNANQACVPESLIGASEAPFAAGVGGDGLFVPLDDSPWAADAAAAVREDVRSSCRVFRVVPDRIDERYERIEELETSEWKIGTDTDRRAGCGRGWTVVVEPEIARPANDELFLRCVAD